MNITEDQIRNKITVPKYFSLYINDKIDLNVEKLILCPFHDDHKPSFSYKPEIGKWRCWSGPCGGGDVIEMHKVNFKLPDRDTASESLRKLLGIVDKEYDFRDIEVKLDMLKVRRLSLETIADKICKGRDDYIELDFLISQRRPVHEEISDLEMFIKLHGGVV